MTENAFTMLRPKAKPGPSPRMRVPINPSLSPMEGNLRHIGPPNLGENRMENRNAALARELDAVLKHSRTVAATGVKRGFRK